jgi:hypothetical protein
VLQAYNHVSEEKIKPLNMEWFYFYKQILHPQNHTEKEVYLFCKYMVLERKFTKMVNSIEDYGFGWRI